MTTSSTAPADPGAARAPAPRASRHWLSLESWAVGAAVIFIILVVAGVFPRVPW